MSSPTPRKTRKASKLQTQPAGGTAPAGYGCIIAPMSTNSKLSAPGHPTVAATYRPVHATHGTCPMACPFHPAHLMPGADPAAYGLDPNDPRLGQCYTGSGPSAFAAAHYKAPSLEQTQWQRLPHAGLLRLHVSGDFLTPSGELDHPYITRLQAELADRPRLKVWGYTHAWEQLSASGYGPTYWGPNVRILASIDHPRQVEQARALGWTTARTIETQADRQPLEAVCPQQLSAAQGLNYPCSACQLCGPRKDGPAPSIAFLLH